MQTPDQELLEPMLGLSTADSVVACASASLDALVTRNHLQTAERNQIEQVHLEGLAEGKENEIFETITRLSTVPPREIPSFMAGLGLAVAKTLKSRVPLIPRLDRMRRPADFFDAYPEAFQAAKTLLCPVLFCEDDEVAGVGSVNPIPALLLARRISDWITERTGVTPFLTVVRLDYDAWRTLIDKEFGV